MSALDEKRPSLPSEMNPTVRMPFDSTEVPTLVNPNNATIDPTPSSSGDRYQRLSELGKGGMGVVRLCHDARIGRDVAMKVIRPESQSSGELCARFLREARVQGQLEHPSIVPVYDVGADEGGAMYFTMKRLQGMTLSQIIKALRAGDEAIAQAYSRRKLLTAFSSLCLAVDFAHSRGVLHRDLKPSNVMLGAYGEVYLLDWGIAKILDSPVTAIDMRDTVRVSATAAGQMLGTPGYIPPEQAYGKNDMLDARSDVYALGCVLFELLTLQPLHPRTDVFEALRSTTQGADARASVRAPERDIPPELDEICVKATMREQSKRYPSARALHDAIEGFMDGDRNMEVRRDLAAKAASRAEQAVVSALAAEGPAAEEARRTAMREVGRALALDPDNEQALLSLHRLFTEPPREVPAEVVADLAKSEGARLRFMLRDGIVADLLGLACSLPFALWLGVKSWFACLALAVLTCVSTAIKLLASRRVGSLTIGVWAYFAFLFNALAVMCMMRAWGPLFVMPFLLATFTQGYSMTARMPYRRSVVMTAFVVQCAAALIEVTGLLPRSYEFKDGVMVIVPRAVLFPEVPTIVALTVFAVFMFVVPVRMMGRVRRMLHEAEQRAFVQAWQLKQLLPQGPPSMPAGSL